MKITAFFKSRKLLSKILLSISLIIGSGFTTNLYAAGTLTPIDSANAPIKIESHNVKISIINGFAMTEVNQTFSNPNNKDLEAIYAFPLPVKASLSEVTIILGEKTINGEVVEKQAAREIYESEKSKGKKTGLAEKDKYKDLKFRVSPVKAGGKAVINFVYYQPLDIDTGMGKYVYPLENGGTDEEAEAFWTTNSKVEGSLNIQVDLKSAYPLTNVRTPGYRAIKKEDLLAEGKYNATYEVPQANLDKDFVFYYKLQDNLPGRIEVVPYRSSKDKDGTFMMVVTPGLDLKPLNRGADYIFVLDNSGSMTGGKLKMLCKAVIKSIGKMRPDDRFKIIIFNTNASELTSDWVNATADNVKTWAEKVAKIETKGSTNMYKALRLCLENIEDDDRATSIILVTDAVVNTGEVNPKAFHHLMKKYDIRVFGFVMGNGANWPLMRLVCDASGGFYTGVSNSGDIIGEILKVKNKVTHESLHHAKMEISGVKTYDTSNLDFNKVYHGEQLVIFGKYKKGGEATVTLKARLTGENKTYSTKFNFPEIDTDNPEIERLWAVDQVERTEDLMNSGIMDESDGKERIKQIGLEYQLVTDETSMLLLTDESFEEHGIDRKNRSRTDWEHRAQSARKNKPVKNYRIDNKRPAFRFKAPSFSSGGGGGGALDPLSVLAGLGFILLALFGYRKEK